VGGVGVANGDAPMSDAPRPHGVFQHARRFALLEAFCARVVEQIEVDALATKALLRPHDGGLEMLGGEALDGRIGGQVDPPAGHDHHVAPGEDPAEHRLRLAGSVGVARVDEVHADLEGAQDRPFGFFGLDLAVAIAREAPRAERQLGHQQACLA
jgi:hypothetical protein